MRSSSACLLIFWLYLIEEHVLPARFRLWWWIHYCIEKEHFIRLKAEIEEDAGGWSVGILES